MKLLRYFPIKESKKKKSTTTKITGKKNIPKRKKRKINNKPVGTSVTTPSSSLINMY